MKNLLSIIIPIYGVELYIEEFAESLLSQITDGVECIFINDGTKDDSMEILNTIIKKYKIEGVLINQSNKGLSSARNSGLKVASGKYITFLDSDDIVVDGYISNIIRIIKENNDVDIIHFNAEVKKKDNEKGIIKLVDETLKSNIDSKFILDNFKKNYWFSWLRIFRADLIKDFYFPDGYVLEDILSLPFIYKENIVIYELCENLVIYRIRDGSLSDVKNNKFHESAEYGISLFRELKDNECMKYIYFHFFEILYDIHFRSGYNDLLNFQKKFSSDFKYISKNIDHHSFKKMIKWSSPRLFYIYKSRFFLKKIN